MAAPKKTFKNRGGTAFGPKGTKLPKTYKGKSTKLGHGGRAKKLLDSGTPPGVVGAIARRKGAAPGGPNYKGGRKGK